MNYINIEKFSSESTETQQILSKWWQLNSSSTDLIMNGEGIELLGDKDPYCFAPLFVEGQLREFIEELLNSEICLIHSKNGYSIQIGYELDEKYYQDISKDALETYWIVACEIAAEKIKHN